MAKNKHWFVPKSYGWGFVPVSWEGWLMTLTLIALLLTSVYNHGMFDSATFEMAQSEVFVAVSSFVIEGVLLISAFSYFAERKTKGEVKWNWGFWKK